MARTVNAAGIALVKQFEGLRLQAYPDPATGGKPFTIGWGHTGDVKPGDNITEHQAEAILGYDLERTAEIVEKMLTGVSATDNQFAALVSLAFNIGVFRLSKSTLLRKFVAGDVAGAAAEFLKWRLAAGKVLPGLVKRRAAERALFLAADETPAP